MVTNDKVKTKKSEGAKASSIKVEEVEEVEADPRKQLFIVKVNHLMAEGKERDNPIPVNDLGDHAHGRATCYPNTESILSQVQINILRDAVERLSVPVNEGSGIYEEPNPLAAAKKQFPGFTSFRDRNTGLIMLQQIKQRFAVEVIKPYVVKKEA